MKEGAGERRWEGVRGAGRSRDGEEGGRGLMWQTQGGGDSGTQGGGDKGVPGGEAGRRWRAMAQEAWLWRRRSVSTAGVGAGGVVLVINPCGTAAPKVRPVGSGDCYLQVCSIHFRWSS